MKIRIRVLSLLAVALLLFAMGGVASADKAEQVIVQISYPCDGDEVECENDGEAVSRWAGGDIVDVYITLLDGGGNPATACPAPGDEPGESLATCTASVFSNLAEPGSIEDNEFAADSVTVEFDGNASARANIDFTQALPGRDQVSVTLQDDPDPLLGSAFVNVVAPMAEGIVLRTLNNLSPPSRIYDPIPPQANNDNNTVRAGNDVSITVIATEGTGRYTPDPRLDGQEVVVKAYANYQPDGIVGPPGDAVGYEDDAIAEVTLTFEDGIAQGDIRIEAAGPAGLQLLFTAKAELDEDDKDDDLGTTQMGDDGVDVTDTTIDTCTMLPQPTGVALMLAGSDDYGNGNRIMQKECFGVYDDASSCGVPGTGEDTLIVLVDAFQNALFADADVPFIPDLVDGCPEPCGSLDDQLRLTCPEFEIDTGTYLEPCQLEDENATDALSVLRGGLEVANPNLDNGTAAVNLIPAIGCGAIDLELTIDEAGNNIKAGSEVVLTINTFGGGEDDVLALLEGDMIDIIADGGALGNQLLSADGFATADTTLPVTIADDDPDTPGIQIPVNIFGKCTEADDENVAFMIKDDCGIMVTSTDPINDLDPEGPTLLAIVGVGDQDTDNDLDKYNDDKPNVWNGTDPIGFEDPFLVDIDAPVTNNFLGDFDEGICDAQSWDEFNNDIDLTPDVVCRAQSGLGTVVYDGCDVGIVYVEAAIGTQDTIICELPDNLDAEPRNFSVDIVGELASDAATSILLGQEGPQGDDGMLMNPTPGGEAIMRIGTNGELAGPINVRIDFGDDSVALAELRTFDGSSRSLPHTITLNPGEIARWVVYAPARGIVNVTAEDLSSTEALLPDALELRFDPTLCTVALSPDSPTRPLGQEIPFSATTTGENCNDGVYNWAILQSDCTGSEINADTGVYKAGAPVGDAESCTDKVQVADTANGNILDETDVTVIACENPTVAINQDQDVVILEPGGSTELCAVTTCDDGSEITGLYAWDLDGEAGADDTTTGACITYTAGLVTGQYTQEVTDTANGDITDTITVSIGDICAVETGLDSYPKSHFWGLPVLITLQTTNIDLPLLFPEVTYTCEADDPERLLFPKSITPVLNSVLFNTIWSTVIIWPTQLTGGADGDTEACTVQVEDCNQLGEFDLNILSIFGIPLDE